MFCPTCHSSIGSGGLSEAARVQGAQGTDPNGNPIPRWSDDPILTNPPTSGDAYRGVNSPRTVHILELQQQITTMETGLGLVLTAFSPIDDTTHISRRHIIELRQAIERLLNVSGATLEDYFKLDSDGTPQTQNPILVGFGAASPQVEWIDVNRGEPYQNKDGVAPSTFTLPDNTVVNSPTLPSDVRVRAIHIEDLRHPIPAQAILTLLVTAPSFAGNYDIYNAKRSKGASFIDATKCHTGI